MLGSRKSTVLGGDKFRDYYSMFFDGVNDSLHFNSPIAGTWNEADGEWNTICCWFKMHSEWKSTQRIWNVEGTNPGLLFASSGSNWRIGYNTGNSDTLGVLDSKDNWLGKWKHVIMSFQRNSVGADTELDNTSANELFPLLWIDGVPQTVAYNGGTASSNSADITDQSDLQIGSNQVMNAVNTQPFYGHMSDIACYKVKFDNQMAKTVYNGREPFDHNSWSTGSNYLTIWGRFGDGDEDIKNPSYGLMTETFTNDEASPGSNDYGNCYNTDNTMLNFVNDSAAVTGGDGYDVVANSAFTANNCTALIETDNTETGLQITNTASSKGTMRAQVVVTSGVEYQLTVEIYDTDESYTDADVEVSIGNSGGGSTDYNSGGSAISTDSHIYKTWEFTTTNTQLDIAIGPDSSTSGHKVRIRKIELLRVDRTFTMQDSSNYNNTKTGKADGGPTVTGDTP